MSFAAALSTLLIGCNSDPDPKPPLTPSAFAPASTQPVQVVAEIGALKLSRSDLDTLLYQSYGLRLMFDLMELDLAKSTLLQEQHTTLTKADIDRERQMIIVKICGDAPPSSYDDLFNQFLTQEKITRAEFEVKVVETGACLRKIVEPIVVGKVPEDKVHRGFDQLYGAKRRIADIAVSNPRDAAIVREMVKTVPFETVARKYSIDTDHAPDGGEWPPFTTQSMEIPEIIRNTAFSTDPGQISDILTVGNTYHIIKVLEAIQPKLMKYEDVKADVRKQMEDRLIEDDIKAIREGMKAQVQRQVLIDDPILKAQWDEILGRSQPKSIDKNQLHQQMDQQLKQSSTMPTTMPAPVQTVK